MVFAVTSSAEKVIHSQTRSRKIRFHVCDASYIALSWNVQCSLRYDWYDWKFQLERYGLASLGLSVEFICILSTPPPTLTFLLPCLPQLVPALADKDKGDVSQEDKA